MGDTQSLGDCPGGSVFLAGMGNVLVLNIGNNPVELHGKTYLSREASTIFFAIPIRLSVISNLIFLFIFHLLQKLLYIPHLYKFAFIWHFPAPSIEQAIFRCNRRVLADARCHWHLIPPIFNNGDLQCHTTSQAGVILMVAGVMEA